VTDKHDLLGVRTQSTLGDLDILMNQPAESIEPHDPNLERWSGGTAPSGAAWPSERRSKFMSATNVAQPGLSQGCATVIGMGTLLGYVGVSHRPAATAECPGGPAAGGAWSHQTAGDDGGVQRGGP
jgi:hypothetical protein